MQTAKQLDLLTSGGDDEILFEKLNNQILVKVAIVFETNVAYLATLSITELNQIMDNVKNGKTTLPEYRMNLVTTNVFEDAMRDCHVHKFQLTYSYVYPRNCRMLIGIPVYRDGYIHEKDRKQN